MRWEDRKESENVEDRRNETGGRGFPRGQVSLPMGGGIGAVGILLVFGLMLLLGVDPRVLFEGGGPQFDTRRETPLERQQARPEEEQLKRFVSVVLAETENVWQSVFQRAGRQYQKPTLVIFSESIGSRCGTGRAEMGPFYCPLDQKLYIDLSFYEMLKKRFHAPGDFAQAYVVAHEVGHHVQLLLGDLEKVMRQKAQLGQREANALQVRLELQADCYAGLWAHHAERAKILDPGDIEEALKAASAIGDDRIQQETKGRVAPDSFTHGTSKQRVHWFTQGFRSGSLQACDTFSQGAF